MKVYRIDWVNWKGTKIDVEVKLETIESKADVLRIFDDFSGIIQTMVEDDLYIEEDPLVS
jgi:hypothetical protein